MNINIVESSLNLRIERGKTRSDYTLHRDIAKKQLSLCDADIFSNVEYMSCNTQGYLDEFNEAGYNHYITLDATGRGILCAIKKEYVVEKIGELSDPHLLHLRVSKENEYLDLITVRLLVAGGTEADFKDRNRQWHKILNYIEGIEDKSHIILTGDFNHGVINDDVRNYRSKPREFYNYQMVLKDLKTKGLELYAIDGYSYKGYMKIDHIATGNKVGVNAAIYKDAFSGSDQIGIPDHSCIVASLMCA